MQFLIEFQVTIGDEHSSHQVTSPQIKIQLATEDRAARIPSIGSGRFARLNQTRNRNVVVKTSTVAVMIQSIKHLTSGQTFGRASPSKILGLKSVTAEDTYWP